MAVHADVGRVADPADDTGDELAEVMRYGVADRVGDVHRGGARGHDLVEDAQQEVGVGAGGVLGRELDVVGVGARLTHRGHGRRDDVVLTGAAQHGAAVDLRRRQEHVDAGAPRALQRLGGAGHVVGRRSRQGRDDRRVGLGADAVGDGSNPIEVTGGGDREAGFDNVDVQPRELLGDLQLLLGVQRDAGRLLAVAQGGVEDDDGAGMIGF